MPFSLTCRTKNISKSQNLNPHQSRITLPSLQWDTLYFFLYTNSEFHCSFYVLSYVNWRHPNISLLNLSIWSLIFFSWLGVTLESKLTGIEPLTEMEKKMQSVGYNPNSTDLVYRGFMPNLNFITTDFITEVFQNFQKIFCLCLCTIVGPQYTPWKRAFLNWVAKILRCTFFW